MADAVQTYLNADSIYEDVEGAIQNATPYKTPGIATIGKSKAKATLHEWLEDTIESPGGSNANVEGADAVNSARQYPSRKQNYTQIMDDTFEVSGTDQAVNLIGRSSDPKYHLGKSLKYLNTELEYAFINNTTAAAGSATVARTFKGMAGWISTNDKSFSSYSTSNAFTTAKLMAMSQAIWDNSDSDHHNLLVNSAAANDIAGWTQDDRIVVNTNAAEKKLVMAVMVLETPFGTINVVLDRYIAVDVDSSNNYTTAYMFAPEKFSIAWLRNWKTSPLAKTGDSQRYQTVGEMTLVCYTEKAAAKCGKIYSG